MNTPVAEKTERQMLQPNKPIFFEIPQKPKLKFFDEFFFTPKAIPFPK
jgi:hypothetical protein